MKSSKKIILASGSPRRKELLKKAGIKFNISVSNFNENIKENLSPHSLVKKLSLEKAKTVFENYRDAIIIGADTIVVCDGKILGKPKDKKDAKKILKFLSSKTHIIITGFTIINEGEIITKSEETKVTMRKITQEEIEAYIKTGEPFDKAGAYAIQGIASKFIEKVEGDYSNAVGLPVKSVLEELKNLGVNIS